MTPRRSMKNVDAIKIKILLGTTVIRNLAVKSGELIRKLFINCHMTIKFIRKHGTYNNFMHLHRF